MRFLNTTLLNAATVGTGINSPAVDASYMINVSMIAEVSGTSPVGVLALQASNDIPVAGELGPFTPTNWSNIATVAVSANGTYLIPKTDVCYRWIRVAYVYTSGSATTATATIKSNGM